MALILALRNQTNLVVASDTGAPGDGTLKFGQFLNVPGRAILLLAGNIAAVEHAIMATVVPKLHADTSAATLAQLVQAALVLEVVPNLPETTGRVEVIVAGIDPIRHTEEPGIYYMDSAQDFYLRVVTEPFVTAGQAAEANTILPTYNLLNASDEELITIAKDCLATTKLRWPTALGAHQRLGIITPRQISVLDY